MINYFRPYDGKKPYIFVSYAHKNSEKVLEIINKLREELYLLWYDEGIPAGSDWPQNIADHMSGCDSVLMFLSKEFHESKNCLMEKTEAEKQGKRIYIYDLDDETCVMPALSEELIGTDEDYKHKKKVSRKFNWWILGLVAAVMLVAASVFAVNRITEGQSLSEIRAQQTHSVDIVFSDNVDTSGLGDIFTKKADFKDIVTENTVKRYLGTEDRQIPVEELLNLNEFMVCGNIMVDDPCEIEFLPSGEVRYRGVTVFKGPVSDLTVQGYMLYLNRLVLANQEITDISPLVPLVDLQYLDISNNDISDLSALDAMNNLSVLHIEHTKVSSVNELKYLKNLQYVYVSADMLPIENDTDIRLKVVW